MIERERLCVCVCAGACARTQGEYVFVRWSVCICVGHGKGSRAHPSCMYVGVCACVHVCLCVCVHNCGRACVRACMHGLPYYIIKIGATCRTSSFSVPHTHAHKHTHTHAHTQAYGKSEYGAKHSGVGFANYVVGNAVQSFWQKEMGKTGSKKLSDPFGTPLNPQPFETLNPRAIKRNLKKVSKKLGDLLGKPLRPKP